MQTTTVLLSLVIASVALGHSHLANPLPTRRLDCRVGNGRPRACHGPCPPLDTYGEPTGVSRQRPAETWRRGQRRWISWHRNNHGKGESGFVRFTLVPVGKMMDKGSHSKFTFQISCWSSGLHRCHSRQKRVCGNDAEGKAYKVEITVPTAYPDGIYVFGWSWYGGGDYSGKSFFGDYYSCSFIRINGGVPVSKEFRPVFNPGLNQKPRDSCLSATDRLGVCWREPCHRGKVVPMKPKDLPRFIRSIDLGHTNQQQNKRHPSTNNAGNGRGNARGSRKGRSRIDVSGVEVHDLRTKKVQLFRREEFSVKTSAYNWGFTMGLKVSGDIGKVVFSIRGRIHEERLPPYIVNGNTGRHMQPFRCHRRERVRFIATVYGIDGRKKSYNYTVTCA